MLVGVTVLRELESSWGVLTETEKRVGKKACSIWQVGGHLLYRKVLGKLHTCDCMHTLASSTTEANEIKVKKARKWTGWGVEVKIEMSIASFLGDHRTGVIKSSSRSVTARNDSEWWASIEVLYWHYVTRSPHKCGALSNTFPQSYRLTEWPVELEFD